MYQLKITKRWKNTCIYIIYICIKYKRDHISDLKVNFCHKPRPMGFPNSLPDLSRKFSTPAFITSPSSLSRRASTTTGEYPPWNESSEFSPENGMGWNTILSFWGPAYFQVIYVSLSCSRRSRSPRWDIKNQQLVPFTSHFWSNHDDLATYAARKHGTYTILHIHKNKQSVLDFLSTNTKRKHGSFWFGTISWCLFIAWVIYWPYLFGRA